MNVRPALLLALALALAPAVPAASDVTVTLVVDHDPTAAATPPLACDVVVPAGADGVAVLDGAKAMGCIVSYKLTYFGSSAFVACLNEVCTVCPPPFLACGYWAFHVNDEWVAYGVSAYAATEGDVLRFAYDLFPLGLVPP